MVFNHVNPAHFLITKTYFKFKTESIAIINKVPDRKTIVLCGLDLRNSTLSATDFLGNFFLGEPVPASQKGKKLPKPILRNMLYRVFLEIFIFRETCDQVCNIFKLFCHFYAPFNCTTKSALNLISSLCELLSPIVI